MEPAARRTPKPTAATTQATLKRFWSAQKRLPLLLLTMMMMMTVPMLYYTCLREDRHCCLAHSLAYSIAHQAPTNLWTAGCFILYEHLWLSAPHCGPCHARAHDLCLSNWEVARASEREWENSCWREGWRRVSLLCAGPKMVPKMIVQAYRPMVMSKSTPPRHQRDVQPGLICLHSPRWFDRSGVRCDHEGVHLHGSDGKTQRQRRCLRVWMHRPLSDCLQRRRGVLPFLDLPLPFLDLSTLISSTRPRPFLWCALRPVHGSWMGRASSLASSPASSPRHFAPFPSLPLLPPCLLLSFPLTSCLPPACLYRTDGTPGRWPAESPGITFGETVPSPRQRDGMQVN